MFGKHKDSRRVPSRYYRCAHALIPAIAATVVFWINQCVQSQVKVKVIYEVVSRNAPLAAFMAPDFNTTYGETIKLATTQCPAF